MRLTLHTEHAVHMLVYLAVNPGARVTVADVAAFYGTSRNHLMKVALNLGRAGYVRGARGRSGGLSLARHLEGIYLGEVVRHMEAFASSGSTRMEHGQRAPSSAISLAGLAAAALKAYLGVFDQCTLADLASGCKVSQGLRGRDSPSGRLGMVPAWQQTEGS
ncbi:RrF2 family transcriptional regulator [Tianweitania sediminis]|uniref:Rrf2 family transcriptional regulator n=1 Tax=Tianweitania sediminis TaxID=1502156 RepID=A0A8J7UIV1_9HYPH|nr:Rrf2 family transcriptional regulator [Tianweitania sediminis]MBP0438029.1 Rrf2 family transcriptional regulator [Tianweitania sediminis]